MEILESKYKKIQINRFEIYDDRTNAQVLRQYDIHYSVPSEKMVVPIVFIGDKYLSGSKEIIDNLEREILENPISRA